MSLHSDMNFIFETCHFVKVLPFCRCSSCSSFEVDSKVVNEHTAEEKYFNKLQAHLYLSERSITSLACLKKLTVEISNVIILIFQYPPT